MSKFVEVAKVEALKSGTMKKVFAEGREILLARVGDKYYATDNRCPHMKGDLSHGKLEGTVVTCPPARLSILCQWWAGAALVEGRTNVETRQCAQNVQGP